MLGLFFLLTYMSGSPAVRTARVKAREDTSLSTKKVKKLGSETVQSLCTGLFSTNSMSSPCRISTKYWQIDPSLQRTVSATKHLLRHTEE